MISANFFNFDAAGNNLPTDTTGKNPSEKDFGAFYDQMFVYPTNASVQLQNANPQANAETKDLVPICIKTNNLNFTTKDNATSRFLPNPMETAGETTVETPPILEMPQILIPPGKQTPIDVPTNPNAGNIGKETKPTTIETPPILPEQTTNPVETPPIFEQPTIETPPIFEQPSNEKPTLVLNNTQKIYETPPIVILPQTQPTKPVTLKTNTQRVETNVEPTIETPPIIVAPENQNASTKTEKTFSTTKAEYLNSIGKTVETGSIKKSENNISKPENNTAKSENNISKAEIKNQFPSILMTTDKTAGTVQKDWNTARTETETLPEINMLQQALNLAKMNGKAVRRESTETVNSTVTSGNDKDYTPILISNENVSLKYSVKTENYDGSGEKPTRLQNILFNLIESKTVDSDEQKGFGKISLNEFQINETAKNPTISKGETNYSVTPKNGETAELVIEANAEMFTKSVFPKRKSLASAYEATNIIRGDESLNAKFEQPQVANTPNVSEKIQITEQVEMQMTELAAKVEQTKETQILKMRLHPAELGTVEIHLEKNANGELHAHLSTESETARTALHENIDQLRNTLEKAGWQVSAVEVTSSTTSTNQFNGSRQNGENQSNNFYQSFSKAENADNLSQTEISEKDDLQHIVSLRA